MVYFLDIECYPNFFMVGLKKLKGDYLVFENPTWELNKIIQNNRIVTFNGIRYDFPMLAVFLDGLSAEDLYKVSKSIINNKINNVFRNFKNEFIYKKGLELCDLIDIAPGVMVSLKMYGARMQYKDLCDLPYSPDMVLDEIQKENVRQYNRKDLDITERLYLELKEDIHLRDSLMERMPNCSNLLIKGNASLGEYLVIKDLYRKKNPLKTNFVQYLPPRNIHFKNQDLNQILCGLDGISLPLDESGKPVLKGEVFKHKIKIGQTCYKIGLGGLHSQEKDLITEGDIMYNADVTSFYPSLILEYGFYPGSYGIEFLDAYRSIYNERVQAKNRGDDVINSAYKLALNSVFGKLGNKYSPMYDPVMLLNVTITGQLLLLMLIEMLEENGCNVRSANTDGVEFQGDPGNVLQEWEKISKMKLEFNTYNKLYARDVNNYIAIWGNKIKSKGVYADPDLKKSWEHPVIFKAIKEFLLNRIPVEETINNCKDITQFLLIRNVTGGCVYKDEFKGRVARWYYSTNGDFIYYDKNHNKVAKSEGSVFVDKLNLRQIPNDLDKNRYIDIAKSTFPLNLMGY